MSRLRRLLKHWRTSKKQGHRLFPPGTLAHFHSIIETSAHRHRADLKLAIEVALPTRAILRDMSARRRAWSIFDQHCAAHDANRNHVLIYINLADRQIEIIADNALSHLLTAAQWRLLCQHITRGFSLGDPAGGVDSALNELIVLLEQAVPATDGSMRPHLQ